MKITDTLLDKLSTDAKVNPRLRLNFDLRNTANDNSQRMLNALEPGTEIPVHRHQSTSETVCVIRGSILQNYYDDQGNIVESFTIESSSSCPFFVVPIGMWHNSVALESGAIIFEAKDGGYEPVNSEDIMPLEKILKVNIQRFIKEEARSCSMEVITPEYIHRMWGGKVCIETIRQILKDSANKYTEI